MGILIPSLLILLSSQMSGLQTRRLVYCRKGFFLKPDVKFFAVFSLTFSLETETRRQVCVQLFLAAVFVNIRHQTEK